MLLYVYWRPCPWFRQNWDCWLIVSCLTSSANNCIHIHNENNSKISTKSIQKWGSDSGKRLFTSIAKIWQVGNGRQYSPLKQLQCPYTLQNLQKMSWVSRERSTLRKRYPPLWSTLIFSLLLPNNPLHSPSREHPCLYLPPLDVMGSSVSCVHRDLGW